MRKRFLLALACSCVLGLICVAALRPATAIQNPGESVIKIFSYDSASEPVKIIGISVAGKKIKHGHPFKPDPNWLKDLKVEVKNVSDNIVTSVEVNLHANSIMASFPMFYGPAYFVGRGPVPDELKVTLLPGATATVEFNPANLPTFEAFLKDRSPEALADNKVAVERVVFEDIDTGWSQGKLVKRVGEKWSVVDDKIGQRLNRGKSFLERLIGSNSLFSSFLPVSASAAPAKQSGVGCFKIIEPLARTSCTCQQSGCTRLAPTWKVALKGEPGSKIASTLQFCIRTDGVACSMRDPRGNTVSCAKFSWMPDTRLPDSSCIGQAIEASDDPIPPPPPPSCNTCTDDNECSPTACGEHIADPFQCYLNDFSGTCEPAHGTPILIDTVGDGFKLTSGNNGVRFNLAGRLHTARLVAWTEANSDDAWLVLDRNGDGLISNGTELFGNFAEQPKTAKGEKRNGFRALAVFDDPTKGGIRDGQIDSRDNIFSSLRLWKDANHDSISQSNELYALHSLGVSAIELNYHESKKEDQYGNIFGWRAKVWGTNGSDVGRWAWDVILARGQ